VVFGRPQGKGSKRALPIRARKGPPRLAVVDTNRHAAPWAHRVSAMAAQAMAEQADGVEVRLVRGAVVVELAFYFARPKSHFGAGRNSERVLASAPKEMVSMPDVDKLTRCALDALTGVVFVDDSQVVELSASKGYGEPERLEATVWDLGSRKAAGGVLRRM